MPYPSPLLLPALLTIAGLGYYGTWHRYTISGGVSALNTSLSSPHPTIPGTPNPLLRTYTGVAAIDELLTLLVLSFWPCLDGSSPSASIYAAHFAAQVIGPVLAMYADSYRRGNVRDKLWWTRSPGFWMMVAQVTAFANCVAVFVGVYAATSEVWGWKGGKKTVFDPVEKVKRVREVNVVDDPVWILLLPVSLFLGHVVPCIAIAWRGQSTESKQIWIAIWQAFPLWVSLFQLLLKPVASILGINQNRLFSSSTKPSRRHLTAARISYATGLFLTSFPHLFILTLTLISKWVPELFAPSVAEHLDPTRILSPRLQYGVWLDEPGLWTEALTDFLQWDQVVAFGGMLLWATVQCLSAAGERGWNVRVVPFALAVAVGYVLAGPGSAVLALQWAKDEILFADADADADAKVVEDGKMRAKKLN